MVPLDLDEFCTWVARQMGLSVVPRPSDSLTEDLGLDEFSCYTLVRKLDELVGQEGELQEEVYLQMGCVRDLHLYYLQVMQEPRTR